MLSLRHVWHVMLFTLGVYALSWFKISFVIGSQLGAFSLAHCLAPLVGIFAGGMGALLYFAIKTTMSLCSVKSVIFACHLPTLAAALYLSCIHTTQYTISFGKKLLLAIIPATAILIFCTHTIGCQAWGYSLFWLIPLAAILLPHQNIALHLLGSTFTAHAVGSVVWLYTVPTMTATMWLNLIPVVVVERCLFATGMYLAYKLFNTIFSTPSLFTQLPTPSNLTSKEI